jgi:hypothetical protein
LQVWLVVHFSQSVGLGRSGAGREWGTVQPGKVKGAAGAPAASKYVLALYKHHLQGLPCFWWLGTSFRAPLDVKSRRALGPGQEAQLLLCRWVNLKNRMPLGGVGHRAGELASEGLW